MKELKEAYETISGWGINIDDFIAQNFNHHLIGGEHGDNSIELAQFFQKQLQVIVDIGLKGADKRLNQDKARCLYCDSELKPAPTKHFWIKKDYNNGICHRCILKLAASVLASMERQVKEKEA